MRPGAIAIQGVEIEPTKQEGDMRIEGALTHHRASATGKSGCGECRVKQQKGSRSASTAVLKPVCAPPGRGCRFRLPVDAYDSKDQGEAESSVR
jgi:hypothetical protein